MCNWFPVGLVTEETHGGNSLEENLQRLHKDNSAFAVRALPQTLAFIKPFWHLQSEREIWSRLKGKKISKTSLTFHSPVCPSFPTILLQTHSPKNEQAVQIHKVKFTVLQFFPLLRLVRASKMSSVSLMATDYVLGPLTVIWALNQLFLFPEAFFKARAVQLSEMLMGALLLQTCCRYLHHCLLSSLGSTRTLVVIGKFFCEQRINHQGLPDFFLYIFPKHRLKIVIDYFPAFYISPRRTVHRKHIDDTCSPSRICLGALHTPPPSHWQCSRCVFFCYSPQGKHSWCCV